MSYFLKLPIARIWDSLKRYFTRSGPDIGMFAVLNKLGKIAHDNAVAHGFYETPPSILERLCLVHLEVSEALEDYRDGHMTPATSGSGKPIGFPSELADIII